MSILIDCLDGLTMRDILRVTAKTGNGQPFYILTSGLEAFCDEYQRIYDDFVGIGVAPSDAIAEAQNTMVCGLIDDGVWAKLDVFYVYAAHANGGGEALMNWVATGLFNAVAFNAPAFVPLEGFTGGTNEYIDWNWNPNADGVNYIQNSASFGIYVRTNSDANEFDMGSRDAVNNSANIRTRRANEIFLSINDLGANALQVANLDSRGMFVASRTAANVRSVYKNKVAASDAEASTAIPNFDFYSLAWNNTGVPGLFADKQVSMVFAGSGLTQTNVDNMTDRFETYMDSNGKGVIP